VNSERQMIENDKQYAEALGEYRILKRSAKGPVERERIETLTDLIDQYETQIGVNGIRKNTEPTTDIC
jgi:hypothetical protein